MKEPLGEKAEIKLRVVSTKVSMYNHESGLLVLSCMTIVALGFYTRKSNLFGDVCFSLPGLITVGLRGNAS